MKPTLYILHAQADLQYEQALSRHLVIYEKQRQDITILRDNDITAGSPTVEERQQFIERADVVVMLITPMFWDVYELALLAMAKKKRIIPVLVTNTMWTETKFGNLRPLPSNNRFVDQWNNRDAAWVDVVQGIKRIWDNVPASAPAAPAVATLAVGTSVVATPAVATPNILTWPPLPPRPPRKPRVPGENSRVLFITANPSETSRLHVGEEMRQVRDRLLRTPHGNLVEIQLVTELRANELVSELLRFRPHFVHFSGHGSSKGAILLVDPNRAGAVHAIEPLALRQLFHILPEPIDCVVLNSCYSAANPEQALALADATGCVVGMDAAIADSSAIAFAASFYEALGFGCNVAQAFELGKQAILMMKHPGPQIPQLHARTPEASQQLFLVDGTEISCQGEISA